MEPPRPHEHKYVAPGGGIILHYLRSRLLSSPSVRCCAIPSKLQMSPSAFYFLFSPASLSRAFPYVICFAWLDVPIHSREGPPFPPLPAAAVNQWSFDQHLHIILRCVRAGGTFRRGRGRPKCESSLPPSQKAVGRPLPCSFNVGL